MNRRLDLPARGIVSMHRIPVLRAVRAVAALSSSARQAKARIEGSSRHRPAAASYAATISSARLRTSCASNPGV